MKIIEGPDSRACGAPRNARVGARAWLALPICLLLLVACQKSVEDRIAEAKLQQEIGSWTESIALLYEILEDSPDDPQANFMLGISQLRMGQAALAVWPLELAARAGRPFVGILGPMRSRLGCGLHPATAVRRCRYSTPSQPFGAARRALCCSGP